MALFPCMGAVETKIKSYYLDTISNGGTMDIASKYADYANLTADNFVLVPQSNSKSASSTISTYCQGGATWYGTLYDTNTGSYSQPSITYDATNGILHYNASISLAGSAYSQSDGGAIKTGDTAPRGSVGLTAKVYLLPVIEDNL